MFDLRYSDDESSEVICIINDVTVLSKSLDGLEPLTSYTVRIRAGNSVGNSDFSTQVTFSTYGEGRPGMHISSVGQISLTQLKESSYLDLVTSLSFFCAGMIEIQATPQITVTVGGVEIVVLQCTLQGADAGDNINYVWMREGDSLPANAEISGGKLNLLKYWMAHLHYFISCLCSMIL